MRPRIPDPLLNSVRSGIPKGAESGLFACGMPQGRTVYGVEIDREGFIRRVGERAVFTLADIRFVPSRIEKVESY